MHEELQEKKVVLSIVVNVYEDGNYLIQVGPEGTNKLIINAVPQYLSYAIRDIKKQLEGN